MPPRGTRSSSRPRLTFDVESEEKLTEIDQEAENQGLSTRRFCLNAVEEALHPTFRFYTFNDLLDRKPPELVDLLKDARGRIDMVGIALRSLYEESSRGEALRKLLHEKIAEGVRMTFITLDPQIKDDDPAYILASKRYAAEPSFDGPTLKEELQKTHRVLGDLYREGAEAEVSVRVLGVKEFPTCGLVVTHRMMQITPYLFGAYPKELDSCFEIDTRTDEGADVEDTFMVYRYRLEGAARLIKEFPK